jgi:hypothetical protein
MYLNGVKNFVITFLIILAVYQTERLWFEDFSDHSLFYSLISDDDLKSASDTKYLMESIMVSTGNGQFIKLSNGIYENSAKIIFDNAVSKILSKNNFKGESQINAKELLNGKCIIYSYGCLLENETLKGMFGTKKNVWSKIDSFDRIIIIPDINIPDSMKVVIENSYENKGWLFEFENDDSITQAYNTAEQISGSNKDSVYYISVAQSGFDLFERNEFVAGWQGNNTEYPSVKMTNPLEKDSGVLLTTIEKYIDGFFENPAVKWNTTINDVYTYSDENTVVKYYTTGVLEYTSYKTKTSIMNHDFMQNYSVALDFLATDTNINNEYYLDSYETENNRIVFHFNYKINNLPIIMTDDFKQKTDMESMIEVTVENGKTVKYRKLVYTFDTDETENIIINTDFLEAVDKTLSGADSQEKISQTKLAYSIKDKNEPVGISWFTEADGTVFMQTASKQE